MLATRLMKIILAGVCEIKNNAAMVSKETRSRISTVPTEWTQAENVFRNATERRFIALVFSPSLGFDHLGEIAVNQPFAAPKCDAPLLDTDAMDA